VRKKKTTLSFPKRGKERSTILLRARGAEKGNRTIAITTHIPRREGMRGLQVEELSLWSEGRGEEKGKEQPQLHNGTKKRKRTPIPIFFHFKGKSNSKTIYVTYYKKGREKSAAHVFEKKRRGNFHCGGGRRRDAPPHPRADGIKISGNSSKKHFHREDAKKKEKLMKVTSASKGQGKEKSKQNGV